MSINVCIFSGNIGNEVQLKKTESGMSVAGHSGGCDTWERLTDYIIQSLPKQLNKDVQMSIFELL